MPSSSKDSEKWQQMLLIINQHSHLFSPNLTWQSKKLSLQRLFTENTLIFILQYIGLNLSTLSLHSSPLWLATGTSCAYLFLRGPSVFPGIYLGTFFAYYFARASFGVAFSCATVLSLQSILLLWFSYQYLGPTLIFYRLQTFIRFILYTLFLTGVAGFIIICICYSSLPHVKTPFLLWLQWWLANFNAIIIFSCALVTFDAYCMNLRAFKFKTNLTLFGLLLLLIITFLFSNSILLSIVLALLIAVLTGFISAYFGWWGAITACCLSGIVLCVAGLLDGAVFARGSITMLLVQLFLSLNTIISLSIAINHKSSFASKFSFS